MVRIFLAFFTIALCITTIGYGQQAYQKELAEQDFLGAIKKAKKTIEQNYNDPYSHYVLGFSNTKLNNPMTAIEHLLLAKKMGFNPNPINLNLARNYLALNKELEALSVLQEAANNGMSQYHLLNGSEFSKLKTYEKFNEIQDMVKSNAYPCKKDPNRVRFNFWLGDWDVFVSGNKIADSKISATNGGCAILEDYRTLGIIAGNSLSHYDSKRKKWMQTYIDAGGRVSYYIEADQPYEGDLQLISKSTVINGNDNNPWIRMTYFNNKDGTVRQYMESSADQGKSWSPIFDGLYKPKKMNSN